MTITIIIFFIAITGAFGMLLFRVWEIKKGIVVPSTREEVLNSKISFRYIEKFLLYLIKYIIQSIVLLSAKLWFLISTKVKIWSKNKLPKILNYIKKGKRASDSRQISFIEKAIIESKINIKKVKDKIKKEHEDIIEEKVDNIL